MKRIILVVATVLLAAGLVYAGPPAVPITVSNDVYDEAAWDGSRKIPTQDALRDIIQTIVAGGLSDLDDLPGDTVDDNLIDIAILGVSADVATLLGYANLAAIKAGLSVDDLVTLSGVADGAANLGTFTGSTVADSQTIKAALQALETALELKQADLAVPSQAEAEAGVATDERVWTAERVKQAIVALAPTSSGDVSSAGDCASGACYDGSSDGGTYVRLYDTNSHYTGLAAGDSSDNLTFTFPTAYATTTPGVVLLSTAGALSSLSDFAQGDVLYFNGTTLAKLAAGTDGYFLKTQGAAANPVWAAPPGGGDITAVGNCANGDCFTDGGTGASLTFEGTDNAFETVLSAVDATGDATVSIPNTTGTITLGPAGYGSDNILLKTDGTGNLTQATGITVADTTNSVTGITDLTLSGDLTVSGDDITMTTNTAGALLVGDDTNFNPVVMSGDATIAANGALSIGADKINDTHIDWGTGANQVSMDDVTDGASYQKVAAADVDASNHVNVLTDSDGTGSISITGPTANRAVTLDDAAQELAARNRDNTFTGANTVGDGDTDILTVRSIMRGGNSRAIWIDDDTTVAPTYATATNELFVEGDVEVGGTVYATSFTATGAGESYITLGNNAGGRSPGAGEYSLWFETDTSDQLKYAVNGAEKSVVNIEDAQTISGAKTLGAALTINRGATGAGQLIIAEDSDDGSNTATITAQAMAASYTLTLPTTDGDSGQYLQTNGSGSLSWAAPSATAHGSDTYVQFNDGGSALGSDAGFTYNKVTQALAVGKAGTDGSLVLYNELGATDYNLTLATNSSQAADVTVTFPAATGTLATLGNAETISGAKTFSANVVLDDGSGASPSMTFTDATDETAVLSKADSGVLSLTTAAADGFNILVGNLWVGNGSPGQTINGEDAYIEGLAEIDGVLNADGGAVVTGNLDVAAAGVRLTGSNGSLTILGLGDGQDEDVKIDLNTTANTIEVTSPASSATAIDINSLNLVATGTISGATPSTTDADGQTLSAAQQYGYMHWATGAGTTNLAGAAAGMTVCVYSTTAAAVVINPDDADVIVLNGTALSAGDSITSASGAGDFICLMAKDAEYWYTLGRSGTWTDTN